MSKEAFGEHGVTAVIGSGWGDEGKGKAIDYLSKEADLVIRYAGGANAGHSISNEYGESVLHLIPSGIFRAMSVLGNGVAVDPGILMGEIDDLRNRGLEVNPDNLLISRDSTLVMPWHKKRDGLREDMRAQQKGKEPIGTTKKGIGPAYSDRTAREGMRVGDLLKSDQELETLVEEEFLWQSQLVRLMSGEKLSGDLSKTEINHLSKMGERTIKRKARDNAPFDLDEVMNQLLMAREVLSPMITHTIPVIWKAFDEGKRILGEGAQGSILDLDLGNGDFVTSTNTGVIGFSRSTGIPGRFLTNVYGVGKAVPSKVGNGSFPTEFDPEFADTLRKIGGEFGATTGRPRRLGWFDPLITRYGLFTGGATSLAVTKLDLLDGIGPVKVCTGYEVNGAFYDRVMDTSPAFLDNAIPVYETMEGWDSTKEARSFDDLPKAAQDYVLRIQELTQFPVSMIGVGRASEATIMM